MAAISKAFLKKNGQPVEVGNEDGLLPVTQGWPTINAALTPDRWMFATFTSSGMVVPVKGPDDIPRLNHGPAARVSPRAEFFTITHEQYWTRIGA